MAPKAKTILTGLEIERERCMDNPAKFHLAHVLVKKHKQYAFLLAC